MVTRQSFIKGTIILAVANAISKILGAVFKIPLTYLLKEEGMAIYSTSFNVYVMLLAFITSGFPLAISKMIAEETALLKNANVKRITDISAVLLGSIGLIGTLVLWFGADFFAYAMKEPKAVYSIKILAPAVFFVALGTVYKSYYQGRSGMTPTAISQVIEALIRLFAGFGFAFYFSSLPVEYTAAAAIMGVTVGEIIATFILYILYLPKRFIPCPEKADKSRKNITNNLTAIALPAIIASVLSSALNLIDITVIRRCLESITFTPESANGFLRLYSSFTNVFDSMPETLRITSKGSRWLYGAYSGYTLTVFHLPIGMLAVLGVSILPVIAGAVAVKNNTLANRCITTATKLTLLVCLPCVFIFAFFSEQVMEILFKNTASADMLKYLSPCLVFICLTQLFSAISNAGGKYILPLLYSFSGGILKLILNVILIRIPHLNMTGTVISADISYFVVMLFSLYTVKKQFSFTSGITDILLKPLLCAGFMALIMKIVYPAFSYIFTVELGAFFATAILGGISYLLMLLFTKSISAEDMKMLKK